LLASSPNRLSGKISQTTEWDNDVPPFPILGGAMARAERTESSKMNGLAINQDNLAVLLFDPLACVPAAIADVDLRTSADLRRTGIGAFLIRALAARYPVVRRLIGDDSFLDAARRLVAMQPPRLPIVQHFGETFPQYLRSLGEAASFEYVADIAELESARARAYHSADARPLDGQVFQHLSTVCFYERGLILHPSVALVVSRFPIVTIWRANQTDAGNSILDLWRPEAALVARPFLDVAVLPLPAGGHVFMNALLGGWTIGAAAASATDDDREFDLDANLTILAEANIVVAFNRHGVDVDVGRLRTRTTPLASRRLAR
jgi:Putative DNA-binding domain